MDMKSQLLSNFTGYIGKHELGNSDDKAVMGNIKTIMESDADYQEFITTLTEGVDYSNSGMDKTSMGTLLGRVKEEIITESSEYVGSTEALSFSVATFPMLVDIYSEPRLGQLCTVYPHNAPILTITKTEWVARIVDIDGSEETHQVPTSSKLIRNSVKTVSLSQSSNIFAELGVTKKTVRISDRGIRFPKVVLNVAGEDVEHEIFTICNSDGYFTEQVEVVDVNGTPTGEIVKIQGQYNRDTGDVSWSLAPLVQATDLNNTAKAVTIDCSFKAHGTGTGIGTTKMEPRQRKIEARMDVADDFELEKPEEFIQDWKALWDMDIISDLHEIIKLQINLNKDAEIAALLFNNIPNARKFKQYIEYDIGQYVTDNNLRPTNVNDIFKNIGPILTNLFDQMMKHTKMEPEFLVAGIKVGSILKSIQEFNVQLEKQSGTFGQSADKPNINKVKIITSDAIEDDFLHLVVKKEEYKYATILEVVYKPLYLIKEVTNSISRIFFRSRNWIGIIRAEGIATIRLKGYKKFFGEEA